jgi:hypothetical protein
VAKTKNHESKKDALPRESGPLRIRWVLRSLRRRNQRASVGNSQEAQTLRPSRLHYFQGESAQRGIKNNFPTSKIKIMNYQITDEKIELLSKETGYKPKGIVWIKDKGASVRFGTKQYLVGFDGTATVVKEFPSNHPFLKNLANERI